MAQFARVNGDNKPVLWLDQPDYTNTGVNAVSSALTVNPMGPKLDFFTFTAAGALTGAEVTQAIQVLQQLATVYIYEYTDDTADTLAVALYPTGAWTTTSITAAMTAAGGGLAGGATTASATFTN
jgi:hypothetical protein